MPLAAALSTFLARQTPRTDETTVWGHGTRLRVRGYLTTELPPLDFVTSVRCLVFRDDAILVLHHPDEMHIVPGGRREPGETLLATLRREVLEETGWAVDEPTLLGFLHFHHLSPQQPGYPYPYPDFLQLVYFAEATAFTPHAILADEYELAADFQPRATVQRLALPAWQLLYLTAALDLRTPFRTPCTL